MTETTLPLILDLVEWVAARPRPYGDAMEAWRTSCPRLSIWEDSVDEGYIRRTRTDGQGTVVTATDKGLALLRAHHRAAGA